MITRVELVEAAEQIDPLPASLTRLLSLINDPDTSMTDLGEIIRYDPILTVDVLRQANSARSSVRDPISDVSAAVARLGMSEVLSITMRRAVHGKMTIALPAYGMDAHELWRHSLTASIAADVIGEFSTVRASSHASTAALLHDIGKMIIAKALPAPLVEQLSHLISNGALPLSQLERALLGIDHGEVGAIAVRAWDLPMSIQIALTNYHQTDGATDSLTHVVAAANAVAHAVSDHASSGVDTLGRDVLLSLNHAGVVHSLVPSLFDRVVERLNLVVNAYQ